MTCGFHLIDFVISVVYEARAGSKERTTAHLLPSSLYVRPYNSVYIINGQLEISWQSSGWNRPDVLCGLTFFTVIATCCSQYKKVQTDPSHPKALNTR